MDLVARMVDECLRPVFEKYKLASYGFELKRIEQATILGGNSFWRGGLILQDMRSNKEHYVRHVLFGLPIHVNIDEFETCFDYQDNIGIVLGYPTTFPRRDPPIWYWYLDETEQAILAEIMNTAPKHIEPVIGLTYMADIVSNHAGCQRHFNKCQDEMLGVGSRLEIYKWVKEWTEE